jgi:hypothetical protein
MDYCVVHEIVWHIPLERHLLELPHEDPIAANSEAKDLLSYYFEYLANLASNPRFIWNEENERGLEHIQTSVETMLEHLKVYSDRYLGDRSYPIGRVSKLINRVGERFWGSKKWLDDAFGKAC